MKASLRPFLALVFLVLVTFGAAPAGQIPLLSVAISIGKGNVVLGSSKGFEIQDPVAGKVLRSFGPGRQVRLRSRGGGIGFGGKMTMLRLVVRPVPGSILSLDGKQYRGYLEIREESGGKITVANVIDVESYLYGVVKSEMPPGAPEAAYHAQAIISRTFALKNRDNFAKRGFGLKATEESQVYVGVRGESPEARRAVDETHGLVLSYGGQLASTFYSAACGGATESNQAVWEGSPEPYLRPVACDYCRAYSGYRWQVDLPFDEVSRRLRANGWPVGRIQAIRLVRSGTGRVRSMLIQSDRGECSVPGNKFRLIMGHHKVKSQRFDIVHEVAQANDVQYDVGESAIRDIIHQYIAAGSSASRSADGRLRLTGTGFGHGVGLCQWGAKSQAELGRDFRQILGYYFSGTRLARAY